jgi:ribosome biogenesis GTPase
MINEAAIAPVILLSKSDLISAEEVEQIKSGIFSIAPQATIVAFSNLSGDNIDAIKNSLSYGKTYCLLGSSGVGKTSLLNSILGSSQFETQTVSKKESKGRIIQSGRFEEQRDCCFK